MPSPLEDEDSVLESQPRARASETKRVLGMIEAEHSSVSTMPLPPAGKKPGQRRGVLHLGSAGAGLCNREDRPKHFEQLAESRRSVQKRREDHRKQVWNKLDAARQRAVEKAPRLDRFRPPRSVRGEHDEET